MGFYLCESDTVLFFAEKVEKRLWKAQVSH